MCNAFYYNMWNTIIYHDAVAAVIKVKNRN